LERLRGIFRYLEHVRLKDGGQEDIPRDFAHRQLLFSESGGMANISVQDFPFLLMYVCVPDSASTIRKDLLLLISGTSAACSGTWIGIRLPLAALGQSRANSSKLRLSQQHVERSVFCCWALGFTVDWNLQQSRCLVCRTGTIFR